MPHDQGPAYVLHLQSFLSAATDNLFVIYEPLAPVRLLTDIRERGIDWVAIDHDSYLNMGCNILAVRPGVVVMVDAAPTVRRAARAARRRGAHLRRLGHLAQGRRRPHLPDRSPAACLSGPTRSTRSSPPRRRWRKQRPEPWPPPEHPRVAGCFVCFPSDEPGPGGDGDMAWAAAAIPPETATAIGITHGAYRPGLLALRAGPVLEEAVRALDDPARRPDRRRHRPRSPAPRRPRRPPRGATRASRRSASRTARCWPTASGRRPSAARTRR